MSYDFTLELERKSLQYFHILNNKFLQKQQWLFVSLKTQGFTYQFDTCTSMQTCTECPYNIYLGSHTQYLSPYWNSKYASYQPIRFNAENLDVPHLPSSTTSAALSTITINLSTRYSSLTFCYLTNIMFDNVFNINTELYTIFPLE